MSWIKKILKQAALISVLLLPIFLTHFRGIAEALIDFVAISFLLYSAIDHQWGWVKQLWFKIALLWWGWILICTIPFDSSHLGGMHAFWQALAVIRFPLFVAALQNWVLVKPLSRKWLVGVIGACVFYIISQMLFQAVFGINFFGVPRFPDGSLTGPYLHPRAAAPVSRILLPISLAISVCFLDKFPRIVGQVCVLFVLIIASGILILAGQRMPFLLFVMGLALSLIWLRSLRPLALVAAGIIPLMVIATAFFSERSFHHLVIHFIDQMSHFSSSPYGLIYGRAGIMTLANPWMGLGFEAFRYNCSNPAFFHAWPPWQIGGGNGGGAEICLPHAHNHYLQALTDAGFPGLLLFVLLIGIWLRELAVGLNKRGETSNEHMLQAWRVGLFAAVFIQEWPLASSSDFVNMPLGGWFFLLLGMGLAYASSYKHLVDNMGKENV